MYYSPSKNGFYDKALTKLLPTDAVEISDDTHQNLLSEQAKGKRLVSTSSGKPIALGQYERHVDGVVVHDVEAELVDLLRQKCANINKACKDAIESGFVSGALGSTYKYDSELEDQLNLSGNIQLGIDVKHRCADSNGNKTFRLHTAEQIRLVGEDMAAHKISCLEKSNALKEQANAAASAKDLDLLKGIKW